MFVFTTGIESAGDITELNCFYSASDLNIFVTPGIETAGDIIDLKHFRVQSGLKGVTHSNLKRYVPTTGFELATDGERTRLGMQPNSCDCVTHCHRWFECDMRRLRFCIDSGCMEGYNFCPLLPLRSAIAVSSAQPNTTT